MFSKSIQIFLVGIQLLYQAIINDTEALLERLASNEASTQRRQRSLQQIDQAHQLQDSFFWSLLIPQVQISFQVQSQVQSQVVFPETSLMFRSHQQIAWLFLLEWDLSFIFDDLWLFEVNMIDRNTDQFNQYGIDLNVVDLNDLDPDPQMTTSKTSLLSQKSDLLYRSISNLSFIDLSCLLVEFQKIEALISINNMQSQYQER